MQKAQRSHSPERVAILQWTAGLGAVTAEALAVREACAVASARARLVAAERERLLLCHRPLTGRPALYVLTAAGMRATGLRGMELCRVSSANAAHAIACAGAAAALERRYPDHRVIGERELRRDERDCGSSVASASLGTGASGAPLLHRPDLVLWPRRPEAELPVAVEVELTVKAPRRLLAICRAWARCRCVAGVLYLTAPEVGRPLLRAIEQARAQGRIVAVPLDALAGEPERVSARTVAADA